MERYFKVSSEFVACILELNSELDYIVQEGLNPESMEIIERVNNRLETLVAQLAKEERSA
ncbi:hypothetical protein [uncultured Intestinimonas sp.]|uniref:hypothetical protein n=1 Tax=uncultured Intestinimonas sp. TaxID=1689265 RepID=UPI0025ECBF39|nr:hypothetical protein [uncultured Intestinimonas sp.]